MAPLRRGLSAGSSWCSPARVYGVKIGGSGVAMARGILGGFVGEVASGVQVVSGRVSAAAGVGSAGGRGGYSGA